MNKEELKPCPVCGGKATLEPLEYEPNDISVGFVAQCSQCDTYQLPCDTEEEAIQAWNNRIGNPTDKQPESVNEPIICPQCGGEGKHGFSRDFPPIEYDCNVCNGIGKIIQLYQPVTDAPITETKCPQCGATVNTAAVDCCTLCGYIFHRWISANDRLPENLELVWLSNGEWVSLGCLVDGHDGYHWAACNGIIFGENGKITGECESEDLDVQFWHPVPDLPG